MYSDRPHAPAAAFSDKISEAVKKERLQALLDLQGQITVKRHQAMVGKVQTVLVEGPSRNLDAGQPALHNNPIRWSGRSSTNHIIHFNIPDTLAQKKQLLTGAFVDIMIEGTYAHSLWGRMINEPIGESSIKGDTIVAA
jgi:tRNA-2-methylthio-N6-dimethylallyladenosine synthase